VFFFEYVLRNSSLKENGNIESSFIPEKYDPILEPFNKFSNFTNGFVLINYVITQTFKFAKTSFTVESDREFVKNKIIELFQNVENAEEFLVNNFIKENKDKYASSSVFIPKECYVSIHSAGKRLGLDISKDLIDTLYEKKLQEDNLLRE